MKRTCGSEENYFKEMNFRKINLKQLNVSKVDFCNLFDPQYCELISPCKPCSFRELQKWPECQATGYRLIKKCDEISNFQPSENKHEWGSSTEVCFPETEELLKKMQFDYGESNIIIKGLLATKEQQELESMSLFTFAIIMGILAAISLYGLNRRKTEIVREAYKKLSLFKR